MLDAMARRYGVTPDTFLVPGDLDIEITMWFRLIMSWMCVEGADLNMRQFILSENARGAMIVPCIPITDIL